MLDDKEVLNIESVEEKELETQPMKFIPKKVFIVPYRNRIQHKFFFSKYMTFILEDQSDYEIYFSHQCDIRSFNRGATRNIGFLAIKHKYPNDYKNMTFIFNDVDTIPFHKIFEYDTQFGVVKHHYGFDYALGGIVVIKGGDFEKTNGYPCFWGWGMEDNVLQKRCNAVNLKIDRSVFYKIGSPEILQLFDGISRIISKKDPWRGEHDNGYDGLSTISKLKYTISEQSDNPIDNVYTIKNDKIFYINIHTFLTYINFENEERFTYDLRAPKRQIIHPDKIRSTKKTVITTQDWTNIPYYPTSSEKRENIEKYLISIGRPVPESLRKEIVEDKKRDIEMDSFNKNVAHNTVVNQSYYQQPIHQNQNFNPHQNPYQNPYQNPHQNQNFNPQQMHPSQYNRFPRSRIGLGGLTHY